ncbi:MAG: chromosomal replication initiator protein DnaA [Geminicoccaceae bacterium]|nr:chromosomal replication initiator protein DnaA [Geminicoccaceae bacterium]MCX8099999.1 chromosomal replication initiator protein DnaA [Geminicoccaceae bacterium]
MGAAPSEVQQQWQQVRALLRAEIGDTAFGTWLKPLDLVEVAGDRAVLAVPTQFMRDWIVANYADRIRILWTRLNPTVRSITLVVRPPGAEPAPPAAPAVRAAEAASEAPADELSARLDPRFTFETFVVGKPNEFAVAAAEKVACSSSPPFNPLFLYGGVGLGKTHLMHAIAWRMRQREPGRRVVYLTAEKFMYQFILALRSKDTIPFKELFRSVDLLMVDDLQFIIGKDSTQEEFFHTFNALVERGRQIVISADRSPSDLDGLEERIRSRLSWGLVADIHPTTYELRLGILQTKAEAAGVDVPLRVLEFLANRITSNVRELEGALNRIVHQASLTNRPVSIEMAQEILKDVLRANDRRVTIEEIQKAVVEHFGLRLADMTSARRQRSVARPRQVAMYLAKLLTPRSLPEIGRRFGGRDHTTVMHAVRQIERLVAEDRQLAEDVEALRRRLQG